MYILIIFYKFKTNLNVTQKRRFDSYPWSKKGT